MEINEAINECELYVQAEARISLVDTDQKGNICFSERDASAIKRLLTYIKEESIPKAVVEEKIGELEEILNKGEK